MRKEYSKDNLEIKSFCEKISKVGKEEIAWLTEYKVNENKYIQHSIMCSYPLDMDSLHRIVCEFIGKSEKEIEKGNYQKYEELLNKELYSRKLSRYGMEVTILSGDRDNFQLASDKVTIRIPRTKMGKTENEDYDRNRIIEEYGLEPSELIEVKGLMGDSSDNIPGVPGVGEKTALNLIKHYRTIENLYKEVENNENLLDVKGKLKEKILDNKELAFLSKQLGTIDRNAPVEENINDLRVVDWNKSEVYNLFKYLKFNRFIERFNMQEEQSVLNDKQLYRKEIIVEEERINELVKQIEEDKRIIYYLDSVDGNSNSIINKSISSITIYNPQANSCCYIPLEENKIQLFRNIFENKEIKKIGYKQKIDYILLKENGINPTGFYYDIELAAYIINPTDNKYNIEKLAIDYLKIDINEYNKKEDKQINLFDINEENEKDKPADKCSICTYVINGIYNETLKKLQETNQLDLFNNIEMPLVEVLADMQFNGIYSDKDELIEFGKTLKEEIERLTNKIYKLAGEEFNINSTKQLGIILFEKLKLPVIKKTKSGYSTDVEVLEKLRKNNRKLECFWWYTMAGKCKR